MSGVLKVDGSGNVELKETDGIDYAPVTVQLPGGERVPFLFTVKSLDAKGSLDAFGGEFVVPSYRGSSFLDPKVTHAAPALAARAACTSAPPSRSSSKLRPATQSTARKRRPSEVTLLRLRLPCLRAAPPATPGPRRVDRLRQCRRAARAQRR